MLGLAPINRLTRVVFILEILLSIIWSGIAIENLPSSLAEVSLTGGKLDFPVGRTPKRLDHFLTSLGPPPESAKKPPPSGSSSVPPSASPGPAESPADADPMHGTDPACLKIPFPPDSLPQFPLILPPNSPVLASKFGLFVSRTKLTPFAIKDQNKMGAITWWNLYGQPYKHLQPLAIKILSQVASSSVVERNWSTYSYIHSMKCNQLGSKKVRTWSIFIPTCVFCNVRMMNTWWGSQNLGCTP